jgi:hypothetical protein
MLPEGSAAMPFKTRQIESIWLGETNRQLHCDGRRRGQCGGNSGPSSLRSGDGAASQPGRQCRAGRRRESQTAGRSGLLLARAGRRPRRSARAIAQRRSRHLFRRVSETENPDCSARNAAVCKEWISAGQHQPALSGRLAIPHIPGPPAFEPHLPNFLPFPTRFRMNDGVCAPASDGLRPHPACR